MEKKSADNQVQTPLPLPFKSQDLIVNSPLWLLHISLYISYENLVLDFDSSFYLISFNILKTCLLNYVWIVGEKFHVNYFWKFKG